MSRILVVDDEDVILETISVYLTKLGYQITTAQEATSALELIDKSEKFDLILSDIKMPKMSGIDFFKKFKEKPENKSRFVLMTGHGDLMNVQLAYGLGVDELLAKPFDFDVLKLVIDFLLENKDSIGSEEDQYFQIPISDIMLSATSKYNLFIKINEKLVCVTRSGQEFTNERLKNFSKKGLHYVYLASKDYAKYTDLQFALADTMKLRPVNSAKKTKAFNHLISTVSTNTIANKLEKESLDRALVAFESYAQLSLNNSHMTDLLVKLIKDNPGLAEKSTLISVISSAVADLWRWKSPKIQSRIVLGALLCDIGLKDLPHLHAKKRIDFTKEEAAEYEQHPFMSYKMLSEIGDLPSEILEIAMQHHENGVATGFPQKLMRNKIHAFARIVHGVNEFVEVLYTQKDITDTKLAIDHIFTLQRKIVSEQVIKSLYMLFKHPVPTQIEGLLLPDVVGRVT